MPHLDTHQPSNTKRERRVVTLCARIKLNSFHTDPEPAHTLVSLGQATRMTTCHGQGGAQPIMPTYPRLAGQSEGYIEYAIKTYKSQERKGAQAALMYPMVQNLTDQDIADLAAYFSTQQ